MKYMLEYILRYEDVERLIREREILDVFVPVAFHLSAERQIFPKE